MARAVLIGLPKATELQLRRALAAGGHEVLHTAKNIGGADIVFHDCADRRYLPLLTALRNVRPSLPFVVVSREKDTAEWLDALEAGATDYCATPLDARYIHWLMELAVPAPPRVTAP